MDAIWDPTGLRVLTSGTPVIYLRYLVVVRERHVDMVRSFEGRTFR